jgi:hypothetical protein
MVEGDAADLGTPARPELLGRRRQPPGERPAVQVRDVSDL